MRKNSISKDFGKWQEWDSLRGRQSERPGAGGGRSSGSPEAAAFGPRSRRPVLPAGRGRARVFRDETGFLIQRTCYPQSLDTRRVS